MGRFDDLSPKAICGDNIPLTASELCSKLGLVQRAPYFIKNEVLSTEIGFTIDSCNSTEAEISSSLNDCEISSHYFSDHTPTSCTSSIYLHCDNGKSLFFF